MKLNITTDEILSMTRRLGKTGVPAENLFEQNTDKNMTRPESAIKLGKHLPKEGLDHSQHHQWHFKELNLSIIQFVY